MATLLLIWEEQTINIDGTRSAPRNMKWGVPQGSVFGPLQFFLYIFPIEDISKGHGLLTTLFADDIQVYISIKPSQREQFLNRLEGCLRDLKTWYSSNMLKCNPDKTECIYFSSKFKPYAEITNVTFDGHHLIPTSVVISSGIKLDKHLTFKHRMNDICRSASLSISRIDKIRDCLDAKN